MTLHLILFFIFCATITGAFLYRGRGGNLIEWRRPFEQMAFCLIFLVAMIAFGVPFLLWLIPFSIAVAVACAGHGPYFPEMKVSVSSRERFDFLLWPFFGKDPRDKSYWPLGDKGTPREEIVLKMQFYGEHRLYWRCIAGMALTGFLISLTPGIAIALCGHIIPGIIIALSGTSKALAYHISNQTGKGTEGGEWGYGGAQWCIVASVIVIFAGVLC